LAIVLTQIPLFHVNAGQMNFHLPLIFICGAGFQPAGFKPVPLNNNAGWKPAPQNNFRAGLG